MLGYEKTEFDIGTGTIHPDETIMKEGRVPAEVYYSRERFEAEKDIFRHGWLNLAEEMELPNPGDWVVRKSHELSRLPKGSIECGCLRTSPEDNPNTAPRREPGFGFPATGVAAPVRG